MNIRILENESLIYWTGRFQIQRIQQMAHEYSIIIICFILWKVIKYLIKHLSDGITVVATNNGNEIKINEKIRCNDTARFTDLVIEYSVQVMRSSYKAPEASRRNAIYVHNTIECMRTLRYGKKLILIKKQKIHTLVSEKQGSMAIGLSHGIMAYMSHLGVRSSYRKQSFCTAYQAINMLHGLKTCGDNIQIHLD